MDESKNPLPDDDRPVSWRQTIGSVLSAFMGVQSSKNRARDFQRGSPIRFIVVGVVMTALFVLTVWLAVRFALHAAGA
ncbi:MAG: DUF2970 domain-containing protein [Sinobacteraceae bacterium]|nr:DUF2970 domain-containing protein [Nevskiaceae bacterium]